MIQRYSKCLGTSQIFAILELCLPSQFWGYILVPQASDERDSESIGAVAPSNKVGSHASGIVCLVKKVCPFLYQAACFVAFYIPFFADVISFTEILATSWVDRRGLPRLSILGMRIVLLCSGGHRGGVGWVGRG